MYIRWSSLLHLPVAFFIDFKKMTTKNLHMLLQHLHWDHIFASYPIFLLLNPQLLGPTSKSLDVAILRFSVKIQEHSY